MTTKSIEQRIEMYWNKRSTDFSRIRRQELDSRNAELWLHLIKKHLPSKVPLRILDVGTGAGFFTILLAKQGHDVVGIDTSADMLREAKKNMLVIGCRATFKKMDAQELNFPDQIFDVVISRNLTWTLPDVTQAYREWYRVLRENGVLLNFDSDCGRTVFSKKDRQADIHAALSDELIEECNSIKNELQISMHRRPQWDIEILSDMCFAVSCDANVSPLVHKDKNLKYDDIPLFGIYAQKQAKELV